MKKLLWAFLVTTLALVCTPTGWGQGQITTATVQGDVLDENGGSVPGASVEAKNLDTNYVRTEATNSDGHFALLSLAPGRYTVTITKQGFAKIVQQNIDLTVGQVLTIPVTLKVSSVAQEIVVTDVPTLEVTKTESSSTLNEVAVENTPVLGRKFEDLLTLTPGVAITQGPDGDEINFNGQRGIFNNVSLDGGDYNNGFFGEQEGGQRAAIDITLEAVKEFQVVASGANAEFGRTGGGVINVITKSGTNDIHGSAFEFFRTEALAAATSDGKPLDNFRRNQFGGSVGGPIQKDKLFFFGAAEGIREDLRRKNLSVPIGTACGVSNPAFNSNISDAAIAASPDCQRQVLLNFFKTATLTPAASNTDESMPINHLVRNGSAFGRVDYNLNAKNQIFGSYNYDWSKNTNQTFDVPTYGTSANGIEGASKIQAVNTNWFSTISNDKLNEAHFTYARENRPRATINSSSVPDTAIGAPAPLGSFRFGQPFFLEPTVDELFYRTDIRDNVSLIKGKHTFKFGGEWIHSRNTQVFRGFFNGRYIFTDVLGFLHYATPGGTGFGPTTVECSDGTFSNKTVGCGAATNNGSPLLLFIQHGPTRAGETKDQSGASSIANEDFSLFVQDTWKVHRNVTLNYGLRWDAQHFPDPTIPPSQTAYGPFLSNPRFASDGTLHNQNKMFQPRVGFAWDVRGNSKSVLRASWGIFNAHQNMLSQVGAITTNGVQQQEIDGGTIPGGFLFPTYPGTVPVTPLAPGTFPLFAGVTVFSKAYANPRIYTTNVGYEQEIYSGWAGYIDLTISKGVHLTRFVNPNVCCSSNDLILKPNTDVQGGTGPFYTGPSPFTPALFTVTNTASSAKSLYRGATIGVRKHFSHGFQLDANYVWSEDLDDDSNERDPFSFRYLDFFNLAREYSYSDRDEKHKFNLITHAELPWKFNLDVRMQAHTAQPQSANPNSTGTGPLCSENNSLHRVLPDPAAPKGVVDCGRNFVRKDNGYFAFNFGVERPIPLGERFRIIPKLEMFNTFNNKNNVNNLSSPILINFDGFLREGVGDPRQAQLSVRFVF
jgi:Carboxypeptidase regulatory-like domain/TonB-dependent Receptor Plug Domain